MDFTTIASQVDLMDVSKALVLIILGVFLGMFANYVVKKIAKVTIYPEIRKNSPGSYKNVRAGVELTGNILKWLIIILFLFQALSVFQIFLLNEILQGFVSFFPKLVIGFLIFVVGMIVTNVITRKIGDLDFKYSKIVSKVIGVILISAIVLSALEAIDIKLTAFIELFKALIYTLGIIIAITIGIGLGFALSPEINKFIKDLKKK